MESVQHIRVGGKFAGCVDAWRNAAAHFAIHAPDRYIRVIIQFSDRSGSYTDANGAALHETEAFYSPDLSYWRADVPQTAFPDGGKVLFKVVGVDTDGGRMVLGAGYCRVSTGFTDDPTDTPAPLSSGDEE